MGDRKLILILAGMAFALLGVARASAADAPATVTILVENDSFFSPSDRDYTNGVELLWTSPPQDEADGAARLAHRLPLFPETGTVRTEYGLGQTIYTPQTLVAVSPPADQRPYGGFLYGKFGLIETGADEQDIFSVQLGVIGPLSLAEDAQKTIHALEGLPKPLGWNTQLRDEPGLVLVYERSLKFAYGDFLDIEPHFGGAAGNVFDYLNAGATLRLGMNMPDEYAPARIEPASPGTSFFAPVAPFGGYLYAGVDERAVARNLFLDGNSFEASPHVDKEILVNDVEAGAVIALDGFRLSLSHVWRSREFRTQPVADEFSSVSLSAAL